MLKSPDQNDPTSPRWAFAVAMQIIALTMVWVGLCVKLWFMFVDYMVGP